MLVNILLILFLINHHNCISPDFRPSKIYTKLTEYLKTVAEYYRTREEPVSITYDDEEETPLARDVANKFIQDVAPSPIFIVTVPANGSNPVQPRNLFYFVDDVQGIEQNVNDLQWDTLAWSVRGPLHFVVCQDLNNRKWLKKAAKLVWKNHILDFIIVFYYNKTVEALEYNPFLDAFRKVNPHKEKRIFSNKLQNMNGYPLRVSMFNDPPRLLNKDGVFYGTEARQLYEFTRNLNASLIIRVAEGNDTDDFFKFYYDDAIWHRSDFGMVTCFAFEANTALKYSYPRRMDDVVAVVPIPKRLPQYQYIFLVFNTNLWIAILVAGNLVSILKYAFDKLYRYSRNDLFNSYLEGFGVPISQPVDSLVNANSPVMTLFIWWCYAAMVLNAAFQCSLTSIIITPKYEKDIRTIQDLKERSCDIYINTWHRGNAGQDKALNACMTTEKEGTIIQKMMEGNTDHAYAVQLSIAETIVSQKFFNNLPIYHIVEEHLVPGYGVYLFPSHTPYNEAENQFLLLDEQFGITKFNSPSVTRVTSTQQHAAAENVALSLDHLQTMFYILIIGVIVSIIAFLLEMIVYNRLK